ncbi:molybdopterin molybdotransferase MoeA [Desulfosoma caldarium]|uniref:Molybdopterin molybdenumtransferase n=1 Tax=Desulfosoma caldarium TaxID=610254 RepID=A0A3N1UR89_9BACT|nr:molybdopterin molybdotransferase MoeA [Desulfosoma caldarium]ROQ91067.1 molybdopterin molybdochelatase [Desulfosoma caldarium]
MTPPREAIALKDAASLAVRFIRPASVEWVPLPQALHRILAQDLIAPFPLPGEARSRMDGYAVRADDTKGATAKQPRTLRCLEPTLSAGTNPSVIVEPGTAYRILTGAVLPRGADAVVPDEDVQRVEKTLRILRETSPGRWVSPQGERIPRGVIAVPSGHRLTPARLAAAAALGCSIVPVAARCRVALASTGDEIQDPGTPLRSAMSYADTRYLLAALVLSAGAVPVHMGCIPDDAARIAAALDKPAGDVVITTGGTGGGNKDLIFHVWNDLGVVPVFQGVAMKPGGSVALGHRKGVLYWALPGSPWAAQVIFHELILPMLHRCYGMKEPWFPPMWARLSRSITGKGREVRAVPGRLVSRRDGLWFDPHPHESSSTLPAMVTSNSYILVPAQGGLETETLVCARRLMGTFLDSNIQDPFQTPQNHALE